MNQPSVDDLKCCVFSKTYTKIGVNQWTKVTEGIELLDDDDEAENNLEPRLVDLTTDTTKQIVQIRVYDENAISLEEDDLQVIIQMLSSDAMTRLRNTSKEMSFLGKALSGSHN